LYASYEAIKKYIDESSKCEISDETKKYFKEKDIKRSFFYQIALIFVRNNIITMTNPKIFLMKIAQGSFTAIFVLFY